MISTLLNTIFSFLYNIIVSPILGLIDLLQTIFTAFAGVNTIYVGNDTITAGNTGEDLDTGIVYYLLRSSTVMNLFYALSTLAVILLVLFTIVQFVKNMYAEKPKPWKDILTSAIKGLAGFFLTPIVCLFGVWAGNILLQTLYTATGSESNYYSNSNMSAQVFVAAAYSANRFRGGVDDFNSVYNKLREFYPELPETPDMSQVGNYADMADQLFKDGKLRIHTTLDTKEFYDMTQFNYLVVIVGGLFMLYALGAIAFGAVKRLFYLVFLFILSPLMNAMYPYDDGNAAKSLNKDFYKQTISVYGAVVALNLFFSILPILQRISLNSYVYILSADMQGILGLIIMICGLMCVKELVGLLSGYIGGGDIYSAGAGVMGGVKGQLTKHGKKIGKVAGEFGKVHGARKAAIARGEKPSAAGAEVFFKDLGKGLSNAVGGVTGVNIGAWIGDAKKGTKEGGEAWLNAQRNREKAESEGTPGIMSRAWNRVAHPIKSHKDAVQKIKDDSPYLKAKETANKGFADAEESEILSELESRIATIKKADEKDQKPLLKQLEKAFKAWAESSGAKWYDKDANLENLQQNIGKHQKITKLNDRYEEEYGMAKKAEQFEINEAKIKNIESEHASSFKDGVLKDSAKNTDWAKEYTSAKEENRTIKAEFDDKKVAIDADSLSRMAVTVGEQLKRAIQEAENITNSSPDFAEFANQISSSVTKGIEELKSKGGNKDDRQSEQFAKMVKFQEETAKAIKDLAKNIEKNNNNKKGGGDGTK